jgi:hypothetical protein
MAQSDEEDDPLWVDLESLDEMELRIIAEKVMELLGRDLRFERERKGWDEQWGGWRQA